MPCLPNAACSTLSSKTVGMTSHETAYTSCQQVLSQSVHCEQELYTCQLKYTNTDGPTDINIHVAVTSDFLYFTVGTGPLKERTEQKGTASKAARSARHIVLSVRLAIHSVQSPSDEHSVHAYSIQAHTRVLAFAATTKETAKPSAAPPPLWFPLYLL